MRNKNSNTFWTMVKKLINNKSQLSTILPEVYNNYYPNVAKKLLNNTAKSTQELTEYLENNQQIKNNLFEFHQIDLETMKELIKWQKF